MSRPPGASVGGQAVLEGVMMRAPGGWAVAVRRPDGVIEAMSRELPRLASRSRLAKIPFFRGIMVLVESLSLGFRALSWSAQKAGIEEEGDAEIPKWQIALTMVVAVTLGIALFALIPVFAADFLKRYVGDSSIAFVVLDGVIRIALIVGYMWVISRSKEIQRVFEYHGAEHMTIHAYEAGDPLSVEAVEAYSPRHPRCGTSFLILVGLVAFFVFLTLAELPFVWQVASRVLLIPVIAGLSYEVLKAAAGYRWMAWASRPGIWLQRITTKQPTDDQIEVAIASLLAALDEGERSAVEARGSIAPGALAAELNIEPA
ncbi:MAG: DUF1385 domain-containing protein [Acidimicrobiia bacterium]|nr:DUF1385 domain-containing protein [Acidimicrobiia bacterium]